MISEIEFARGNVQDLEVFNGLSLDDAVDRLASREGLSREKSARRVYAMIEQNLLDLFDPSPPRIFLTYFVSIYSLWFWSLMLGVSLTLFSVYILPQTEPWIYLRNMLGLVYVLYLPGAALIETLYPEKAEIDDLERFALSIGLSMAVSPLVGLILNYTPWGIRLDPILASLSILTMTLGVTGIYRKFEYHKLRLEMGVKDHGK